jgi:hypothetical protein
VQQFDVSRYSSRLGCLMQLYSLARRRHIDGDQQPHSQSQTTRRVVAGRSQFVIPSRPEGRAIHDSNARLAAMPHSPIINFLTVRLSRGDQTGSRIFLRLWSYVTVWSFDEACIVDGTSLLPYCLPIWERERGRLDNWDNLVFRFRFLINAWKSGSTTIKGWPPPEANHRAISWKCAC